MSSAVDYQLHLDRVSRSFAFCIRQLSSPLREWIALSYLLCRVVDTIEDAVWLNPEDQAEAFRRFDRALLDPSHLADMVNFADAFPVTISAGEVELLKDAQALLSDHHALPESVKPILAELISSMSQGMQHFCQLKQNGALRLKSLGEVNQYCFFVAGIVGELLAKLVAKVEPRFQLSNGVLVRAHHFGLFLQKVNLLKDQVGDEKEGRHLIPSRDLVEESSIENATRALEFLQALPEAQVEFRRFCAWSLFLGLEALLAARRSLKEQRIVKVTRERTTELLGEIETRLLDNLALEKLFHTLTERLGWPARVQVSEGRCPEWMLKLYHGLLGPDDLGQILSN